MSEIDPREPEARDSSSYDRRIDAVAAAAGIRPEQLQILAEQEVRLPLTERTLRRFKVLDRKEGRSARIALDERDGVVDADELMRAERAEDFERHGTMQRALHAVVERAERSRRKATVPVLIKYRIEDEEADFDKRQLESVDDEAVAQLDERAGRYEQQRRASVADVHNKTLGVLDAEAAGDFRSSGPFVRANLTPEMVRRIARSDRVEYVGLDGEREIPDYPTIAESLPTTRTDTVHGTGVTGDGVKIAVLESGTLWKDEACFNIADTQDTTLAVNSHMTKSVAIIGNRYNDGECDGDWEGYAPGADVYLANAASYTDRYDWARARGVNVVTMSWHFGSEEDSGDLHSRDVYFDYWVLRWPYPSIFVSAGNQYEDDAFASGKGYNFLGVGNVLNDGDGDRCNDAISDDSSSKNPTTPHSDREIPEIASPGSRHDLLGSSFGGTSCATPVTASIAALLMDKNGGLKIWPEAIRAILLATANYQNADGANWSKWSDGRDGTGLTNALYAMWTAGRRETTATQQYRAHDYGRMTADDFDGGFYEKTWKAKTFTTNARIRVALTWNSKVAASDGDPVSSVLDADLDLWVYDPDGHLVAFSTTWDSNYEFIEFTPTKVGAYEIKVRGYSVPADFASWYGIAWTAHYDLC